MPGRGRHNRFARLAALFAMLAHLLAAIPLAEARNGLHRTILCTPEGRVEIVIDLATGKPVERSNDMSCEHCGACAATVLSEPRPPQLLDRLALRAGVLPGHLRPFSSSTPGGGLARAPPNR